MLGRYFIMGRARRHLVRARASSSQTIKKRCFLNYCVVKTVFCLSLIIHAQNSFALGVGAAEADSFIGQRLSVNIPLFNVSKPNSLEINLVAEQFGGDDQSIVQAWLDRSNSQLAIKLSSVESVNEPYLNFTLNLVDDNVEFKKEFTVLLNLPAVLESTGSSESLLQTSALGENDNAQLREPTIISGREVFSSASLMGPYDTAVAGQIPKRFGAVIDGQSLWRVARRINGAMGVTRSQMMWALYQANPGAFSSDSIESLRAGSYLTIPSEDLVKQLSDSQAKASLQALGRSNAVNIKVLDSDTSKQKVVTSKFASAGYEVTQKSISTESLASPVEASNKTLEAPFQVTSINEAGHGASAETQSQSIIASLTETVGNMSQQLERKDKKIEFLEEQVEELKSFIRDDSLVALSADNPVQNVPLNNAINAGGTSLLKAQEPVGKVEAQHRLMSILPWALLGLFFIVGLLYAARERLYFLAQTLNLFDKRAAMEFSVAETQLESVSKATEEISTIRCRTSSISDDLSFDQDDLFDEGSISVHNNSTDTDGFEEEASLSFDGAYEGKEAGVVEISDFSIPNIESSNTIAVEATLPKMKADGRIRIVKNGLPDGALDNYYDEGEISKTIEFLAGEISSREGDGDMAFEQRFDRLLVEKDYDFARELLDFARYNEINDERYHFERLRMLGNIGDEDEFYEYYYSIEEKIAGFRQQIQTQISQLVVEIAQS